MNKDENIKTLYRNLVILLKIFKNRPNHLAKYLIDNSAFDKSFIDSIINSEKLNEINPEETRGYFEKPINLDIPYFSDYDQMYDYYNDMVVNNIKEDKDPIIIEKDLNDKLSDLLSNEDYLEAAKLRDYMNNNNIKINQ